MKIRSIIRHGISVLLAVLMSAPAMAQNIFDLEDSEVECLDFSAPTRPSEAKTLATDPNNIWEPDAKLIKTEICPFPFDFHDSPATMRCKIYSDGTQKCELENGDFIYFKVDSVMNQYSGEKEPNLNYRLPDRPSSYDHEFWPSAYFPKKRGILARRSYENLKWLYYRITDDGPLMCKYIGSHYTLTQDVERKAASGNGVLRYVLAGHYFSYKPGGSLKIKEDNRIYKYDAQKGLYTNPDTPFAFGFKYDLCYYDDERLTRNRQLVPFRDKEIVCQVAATDSITYLEDKTNYAIAHYANGDYVKYSLMEGKEWTPFEASLKRGNGLIGRFLMRGGEPWPVVEFTSGPCKGYYMTARNVLTESPIKCKGQVYNAGFKDITYINEDGLTSEQAAEGRAKIENRLYQTYCQKYGKQYVDALKSKKIIPGMPERLVKEVLNYSIISKSDFGERCTVYLSSPHFSTIENKFTDYDPAAYRLFTTEYIVSFVNGKVSSVTIVQ